MFDAPAASVWDALRAVDRYRSWWPWLDELDPVGRFAPGARWRCAVRSPLAVTVRFCVHLDTVHDTGQLDMAQPDASATVRARVTGDVHGTASIDLVAGPDGTRVRFRSELAPRHRVLRAALRVAPPLARHAHDRIVSSGLDRFRACALPTRHR